MTENIQCNTAANMAQHFHQYFDFLVSQERSKLLTKLASGKAEVGEMYIDIDQRVSYLKGAVRIGKLLCLISTEEAKSRHTELDHERGALRGACAEHYGVSEPDKHNHMQRSEKRDYHSLLTQGAE